MKKTRKNKKRKRNISQGVICILFLLLLFLTALFLLQKPEMTPVENLRFEVGQTITKADLVKEIKNGILLESDDKIFSDKPGTVSVLLRLRNRIGIDSEHTLDIEFFLGSSPVIEAPDQIEITAGENADLLSGVSAGENCTLRIKGDYDLATPGVYSLFFQAVDPWGNTVAEKPFTVTVKVPFQPFGENGRPVPGEYTTPTGHKMIVEQDGTTYIDGYLILNKSYSIPRSYNLTRSLTAETTNAYYQMRSAASAAGYTLKLDNGARNWDDQNWIFNNYVKNDCLENALTYSARAGHSEHQSGLAMDLVTSGSQEALLPQNAAVLNWLNENAYRYGFILRYPEGKEAITGYIFESWHYRYVGVELAEKLYNNGDWITMEEYFGIDSVYRGY